MVWDKDLTWDGVSWKTKYKMSKQTTISTTGGVNTVQVMIRRLEKVTDKRFTISAFSSSIW